MPLDSMTIAPFEAAYTVRNGSATMPFTELVLISKPPPVRSMWGLAYRHPYMVPLTLTSSVRSITSSDPSWNTPAGRRLPVHSCASYKLMIGKGLRNLVSQTLPAEMRTEETIAACLDQLIADYREHCLDKTRLYDGSPTL